MNTVTSDVSKDESDNLTIALAMKKCPFCDNTYTRFHKVRIHIFLKHQKEVEARKRNKHGLIHAYNDSSIKKYTKRMYKIVSKYACVSCPDTFDNKTEFANHVNAMHLVQAPASCIETSKTTGFTIDCHFNELLSMSDILVLQKWYSYQNLPVDTFPSYLLRSMYADVIRNYPRCTFNSQLLYKVMDIIQRYIEDELDEEQAKIELLQYSHITETNEKVAIKTIVSLIPYLYDCTLSTLSEACLTAAKVHPFVHELLSSKMPTKTVRCSNIIPGENTGSKDRPDYKIDVYSPGYQFNYTNACRILR